jgi:hypothetical protein
LATDVDKLIEQARKAASDMGGLLALLLVVRTGDVSHVYFDPTKGQFIVNGRLVPLSTIRNQLTKIESDLGKKIVSYNDKLFSGQWEMPKWRTEMQKLVENSHVILAALAIGGIVLAARNDIVSRKLDRDTGYLDKFQAALRRGQVPSKPMANNRGKAYLRSSWVIYHLIEHQLKVRAGFKEAKRILTHAEHCHNRLGLGGIQEGCYEAALRGWMSIYEMPPIGSLVCGQFCKCYVIYR